MPGQLSCVHVWTSRGILFFRGIVPLDTVMTVRRKVLEQCAVAGWLDPA